MSKSKTTKKKRVSKKKGEVHVKKKLSPTTSRSMRDTASGRKKEEFIFGKQNYILMAAGAGIILLGLVMMIGGSMPDDDTWDPNLIYGFRITVLAPFLMLVGFSLEIYAIFKK